MIPSSFAVFATFVGPTIFVSCAKTVLSETEIAFVMSIGPSDSPSKLWTYQYLLPRKIETGPDLSVVSGEIPCFSAVASTNGLNEEPGCRSPCTARLNWLSWKLLPPYIASTAPVRGSSATSAACGPFGSGSHLWIAVRASFCSSRLIVVSTR